MYRVLDSRYRRMWDLVDKLLGGAPLPGHRVVDSESELVIPGNCKNPERAYG